MHLKKILTFSLLQFIIFQVTGQNLVQDPNLTKGVLPNGFQYYIYHSDKEKNTAEMHLVVKAGSLQENDNQTGMAHFVEHLAFSGTSTFPKNTIIDTLEKLGVKFGSHLNAHTSYDETVYKLSINTGNSANLKTAFSIFKSWASELTFDKEAIEKEKNVIIEEWRARQSADKRLGEQYLPQIFYGSRYLSRNPIGNLDILRTLKRPSFLVFYKDWYRPELMAMIVVTDTDPRLVEKEIQTHFSHFKNRSEKERKYFDLPPHTDTLFSFATDVEAKGINISIFKKLPAFSSLNTDSDYLDYLKRQFVNKLSKKRFQRLQQLHKPFLDGSISLGSLLPKNSIQTASASFSEKNISQGLKSFLDEYARIGRYGFTEEEIEELKLEYSSQLTRSIKTESKPHSSALLSQLKDIAFDGGVLIDNKEKIRLYEKLSASIDSMSVLQYFQQFMAPGNTVVVMTAPERLKDSLPDKTTLRNLIGDTEGRLLAVWQDGEFVPEKLLAEIPTRGKITGKDSIRELGVEKWTLSNGTTVWLKYSSERKNYVQMSAFRQGGIYSLDSSLHVSAGFVRSIIAPSGAGDFTRNALSKYLSGNSASAIMVLSDFREGISASANTDDLEIMFQLLYLKWTSPKIDNTIFQIQKKNALESIEKGEKVPYYEFNRQLSERLRGKSNIREQISKERLAQDLTSDNILKAYKERFSSARGFQFIFAGDFDKAQLQDYIETYIAGLPGEPVSTEYKYAGVIIEEPVYERIQTYDNADKKAIVNLFFQTCDVTHDYPEILQSQVLEEILKVKLRERLRDNHAAIYSVGVSITSTNKPENLMRARINFSCDPDKVDFLIAETRDVIFQLQKNPAAMKELLLSVKKQLLIAHENETSKITYWTSNLRNMIFNGYSGINHLISYPALVNNITANDISMLAKKYFEKSQITEAVRMPKHQ